MATAAPQDILTIQYENPASPAGNWAVSNGKTYPDGSAPGYEWVQVTTPLEEYDEASLVGPPAG